MRVVDRRVQLSVCCGGAENMGGGTGDFTGRRGAGKAEGLVPWGGHLPWKARR